MIDYLVDALVGVWRRLNLRFSGPEYALGERRHGQLVPASGAVEGNGIRIDARDGAATKDVAVVRITPIEDSELVTVEAP